MVQKGDKVTIKNPKPKNWKEGVVAYFKKDNDLKYFVEKEIYEIDEVHGSEKHGWSVWIRDDRDLKTYFKLPDPRVKILQSVE